MLSLGTKLQPTHKLGNDSRANRTLNRCNAHRSRSKSSFPPIREACGHFRRPQKPLSEHTEYPKSRSMGLFWNLNRAPVTTFAPVRAGKAQKCDPSEPAAANRTSRGLREYRFSAPAPLPLEYFTRLFLEYTVLLEPFFLRIPARRTLGSADSRGLGAGAENVYSRGPRGGAIRCSGLARIPLLGVSRSNGRKRDHIEPIQNPKEPYG